MKHGKLTITIIILLSNLLLAQRLNANDCESALVLNEGENNVSIGESGMHYFSFSVPSDQSKVLFDFGEDYQLYVSSGSCNELNGIDNGIRSIMVSGLSQGETYVIDTEINNAPIDLIIDVTVFPADPGDICENPISVSLGSTTVEATELKSTWYTYTKSTDPDKKVSLRAGSGQYIRAWEGTCDNLNYLDFKVDQDMILTEFPPGQSILFETSRRSSQTELLIEELDLEQGDACSLAIPLSDNVIVEVNSEMNKWYSFTRSNDPDKKIVINTTGGDVQIIAYHGSCEQLGFINSQENSMNLPDILPGQTVFIRVNAENLEAELTVNEQNLQDGDNCSLAIPIAEGEHTFTFSETQSTLWYSLEASASGTLLIDQEDEIEVDIYSGACDQLNQIGGNFGDASASVTSGETVFIRLEGTSSYDFTIYIEPQPDHECELATSLTTGIQIVDAAETNNWYTYKRSQDPNKKVVISSSDEFQNLYAQTGECPLLKYLDFHKGQLSLPELDLGETIYLEVYASNSSSELTIQELELVEGDNCDNATSIAIGDHMVPANDNQTAYWYSFVAPSPGLLEITLDENNRVDFYRGECQDINHYGGGYGNFSELVEEGEEVFLRFESINSYNFSLNIVQPPAGISCEYALELQEGSNQIDPGEFNQYWASYTVEVNEPSKLAINLDDPSISFVVYRGTCDNYFQAPPINGYEEINIPEVNDGQKVIIRLYGVNGVDLLDVSISTTPLQPGDICETAVEATLGENVVPSEASSNFWMRYVMPESGRKLRISSNEENSPRLEFFLSCSDGNPRKIGFDELELEGLFAGTEVLINAQGLSETAYSLLFEVIDFEQGELCNEAFTATLGLNTTEGLDLSKNYWFSYTMDLSKKLVVNAPEAAFAVYSGSCEEREAIGYDNGLGSHGDGPEDDGMVEVIDPSSENIYIWFVNFVEGFSFELSEIDSEEGESCTDPIIAQQGSNDLPENLVEQFAWYSYSIQSDQVGLSIENGNHHGAVQIVRKYGDCTNEANIEPLGSGYRELTVFDDFESGDEVLIIWYDHYEPFEWSLTEIPQFPGDRCDNPIIAVEGQNSVETNREEIWVAYTAKSFGSKITIETSIGSPSVYKDCLGGSSYDWLYSASENLIIVDLNEGETTLLKFRANEEDFNFKITEEPFLDCQEARIAIEGSNEVPINEDLNDPIWYRYTIEEASQELRIITSQGNGGFILRGDCDELEVLKYINPNTVLSGYDFNPGENIYLVWTYSEGEFSFDIETENEPQGSSCSTALNSVIGTNEYDLNGFQESFWAKYTVNSSNKNLTVSSSRPYESIYLYDNCNTGYSYNAYNKAVSYPGLNAGDEIWIRVLLNGGGDMTLTITEEDLIEGQSCENLVTIQEGIVEVPYRDYIHHWMEYTFKSDGFVEIIKHDPQSFIEMYRGDCSDRDYTGSKYSGIFNAGESIFITTSTSLFSFELIERGIEDGVSCSSPFQAASGVNNVPSRDFSGIWYSYTMISDQNLSVTTSGNPDNLDGGFTVNGCQEENIGGYYEQGDFIISNLAIGDEVKLWFDKEPETSFEFTLMEVPLEEGDGCSDPNIASLGLNQASSYQWFTFTPVSTDQYLLSSIGRTFSDTKVSVYDGCNGSLLASNDNHGDSYQSQVLVELAQNQSVVIVWESDETNATYNWTLQQSQTISVDPVGNKSLGDPSFEINWTNSSGLPASAYVVSGPAIILGNLITLTGESGIVNVHVSHPGSLEYSPASATISFAVADPQLLDQTITFNELADLTVLDGPFELTASASSGLPVGFDVVNGPAEIVGSTLYPHGLGEVTIRAFQFGSESINPADPITRSFEITRVGQSINFSGIEDKLTNASSFNINVSATSGLDVILSIEGPATLNGTLVSLTGEEGTVSIIATQEGDEIYAPAQSVERSFEVEDPLATDLEFGRIEIFPNPTVGFISVNANQDHSFGLIVYDITGVVVKEVSEISTGELINLSEINSGSYFIKIYDLTQAEKAVYRRIILRK